MIAQFKIKPEFADKKELDLVFDVVEYRGEQILGKLSGNPMGFAIEPVEQFNIHQIQFI